MQRIHTKFHHFFCNDNDKKLITIKTYTMASIIVLGLDVSATLGWGMHLCSHLSEGPSKEKAAGSAQTQHGTQQLQQKQYHQQHGLQLASCRYFFCLPGLQHPLDIAGQLGQREWPALVFCSPKQLAPTSCSAMHPCFYLREMLQDTQHFSTPLLHTQKQVLILQTLI